MLCYSGYSQAKHKTLFATNALKILGKLSGLKRQTIYSNSILRELESLFDSKSLSARRSFLLLARIPKPLALQLCFQLQNVFKCRFSS